jgi:hypothetical protein
MANVSRSSVKNFLESLGLDEGRVRALRGLSTLGIVAGFSIVASALLFPRFPSAFLDLVLGDYGHLMDALVVSDRVFSLIAGFTALSFSAIVHFAFDLYLGVFENISSYSRRSRLRMLVLTSFFLSFVIARVAVVLSGIVGPETVSGTAGWLPVNEIWISGYHIHHFFFGFLALAASGWIMLFHEEFPDYYAGVLYGTGLGIFLDEFGMLLTEGDYFASSSYFAAMTFLSLLLLGVYWDRKTYEGLED